MTRNLPVEERLKRHIIDGEKVGLEDNLKLALESHDALDIINNVLLDGMKTVGELFGSGQMQLPFVLQSAEVMKAAVRFLEPFMEKKGGATAKGTMVLATVKGDVHDIGKNLVDIILTNNGYRVVNLGIKQPIEDILQAAEEHKADAVGMSGLLVKSTLIMRDNLELMNERGLSVPVVLGGAALTRRYVEEDLESLYAGRLFYARDAFDGLHMMDMLTGSGAYAEASGAAPARAAKAVAGAGMALVKESDSAVDDAEDLVGEDAKLGARAARARPRGVLKSREASVAHHPLGREPGRGHPARTLLRLARGRSTSRSPTCSASSTRRRSSRVSGSSSRGGGRRTSTAPSSRRKCAPSTKG